jgi:hypothetical protein
LREKIEERSLEKIGEIFSFSENSQDLKSPTKNIQQFSLFLSLSLRKKNQGENSSNEPEKKLLFKFTSII